MESLTDNFIFLTDSYKVTQWPQYPKNTKNVYSYGESRGGKFPYVIPFGYQYILRRYFSGPVIDQYMINEAYELFAEHFGNVKLFNKEGWQYILKKYDGCLPISIKAVPEGTKVPVQNVLMTVEATDPNCYWLVNYLETLLVQSWYPTTVATQSHVIKESIQTYLDETGCGDISFKLHDFGFRGVSSVESAAIGGAAHLINFMGTDTLIALKLLKHFYFAKKVAGYSIPASEHSTICSWGKANEYAAYNNMLMQFPDGIMACVSDSYDIFNACRNIWGTQLKGNIVQRDGTLVIRLDSGELPYTIIKVLEILEERFGMKKNDKGYKTLPPYLRIIQGDGVNLESINIILEEMMRKGYSVDNIAFGMGGALLQKLDRDTQQFAFKCSSVNIDGEEKDVYKTPIGDMGKKSKKGRLKLYNSNNWGLETISSSGYEGNFERIDDELVEVFRDGIILKQYTLEEIRERARR